MAKFVACTIVLAVVPMTLLDDSSRQAFLGYYLGMITMWCAAMVAGASGAAKAAQQQ